MKDYCLRLKEAECVRVAGRQRDADQAWMLTRCMRKCARQPLHIVTAADERQ